MDPIASRNHLQQGTGLSRQKLFLSTNMLVVIDDAQTSYYDAELWSFIKKLHPPLTPMFLLVTSYGSWESAALSQTHGTPMVFHEDQVVSMTWQSEDEDELEEGANFKPVGLILLEDEAKDLIARTLWYSIPRVQFADDLIMHLLRLSGLHAGALP